MLQGFSGIQNLNGSLLVYQIQYANFNVIFYWKNTCKINFSELNLLKCKILNKMNFLSGKKVLCSFYTNARISSKGKNSSPADVNFSFW